MIRTVCVPERGEISFEVINATYKGGNPHTIEQVDLNAVQQVGPIDMSYLPPVDLATDGPFRKASASVQPISVHGTVEAHLNWKSGGTLTDKVNVTLIHNWNKGGAQQEIVFDMEISRASLAAYEDDKFINFVMPIDPDADYASHTFTIALTPTITNNNTVDAFSDVHFEYRAV